MTCDKIRAISSCDQMNRRQLATNQNCEYSHATYTSLRSITIQDSAIMNAFGFLLSISLFHISTAPDPCSLYTTIAAGCFTGHVGIGISCCLLACIARRPCDGTACIDREDWKDFPHTETECGQLCCKLVFPTCVPCAMTGEGIGAAFCGIIHPRQQRQQSEPAAPGYSAEQGARYLRGQRNLAEREPIYSPTGPTRNQPIRGITIMTANPIDSIVTGVVVEPQSREDVNA